MAASQITIPLKGVILDGELNLPHSPYGLVLFAHGSGSSRKSPRNRYVASLLQKTGFGTLLLDLLTEQEEETEAVTRHLRFDIPFLATRLIEVTLWTLDQPATRDIKPAYFGSSTGAAAALVAAARLGETIRAVVSRGGRPDLARSSLGLVVAPTLLIVGGNDLPVMPLNEEAFENLRCQKALRVVPGASHLFEEAGALETVTQLASAWFLTHLPPVARN